MADREAAAQWSATTGVFGPGEMLGGRYAIRRLLGEGGMGAVYEAENTSTGSIVAVKSLRGEGMANERARQRLLREARALGAVRHPSIVDVYDVGEHRGVPFLVMELLEGEPLDRVLAMGPLLVADAVALLMPALRGVAAAHQQGVVHRDLKPENIFICRSSTGLLTEVKVLDFGISRFVEDANKLDSQNLTRTGTIMGTPRYMAPEQLTGSKVDARADVYALGVILFECVTGKVPFDAETFALMATDKLTKKAPSIRSVTSALPRALDKVVQRALATDPAKRYADVASFAMALEPFGSVSFGTVGRKMPTPAPHRSETRLSLRPEEVDAIRRRRLLRIVAAGLILVGLAATAAAITWLLVGDSVRSEPMATPPSEPEQPPASPADDGPRPVEEAIGPAAAGESEPTESERATGSEPTLAESDGAGQSDDVPAAAEPETEEGADPDTPQARTRGTRMGRGRTGRLSWDDF